ncbi:hypothetical protein A2V82_03455 [candidate division KSB1 bacterium RBG_16_48_16]|nr:MAG: hypothetical protein A2V82_03455 [candidate division KSB1 bacterium RBG_16_48_16]
MYLKYFKIKEEPFSTTPNPKFLFKSRTHQEALDRIVTSVSQRRGINAIIGEPGLGKSMLIRTMLSGLKENVRFAWVFNTTLNARELLKYICRDFGFRPKGRDTSDLLMDLYAFLMKEFEQGIFTLLIIDEAQNLKVEVLEEIRQLSNLETTSNKLLQVVLSGQPQLDTHLEHPALQQLKQRINLKATLSRLNLHETKEYIHRRLQVAGSKRDDLFSDAALDAVYEISDGIPRLINQVCDNCLMEAAKRKCNQVESVLVRELLERGDIMAASKPAKPKKETRPVQEFDRLIRKSPPLAYVPTPNNGHSNIGSKILDTVLSSGFDGLDLGTLAIN